MLKFSGLFIILSIIIAIIFTEVVQMSSFEKSSEVTLFVANNGSDAWSGRIATPNAAETDGPFVTLERARDEIRRMKQSGELPAGGVTVELQGGVYQREGAFELSDEDSGREGAPVVYRARQGEDVRLVGGKVVTVSVKNPVPETKVNVYAALRCFQ